MVLNYMPETLLDAAGSSLAERAKYVTADNVYRDFNKVRYPHTLCIPCLTPPSYRDFNKAYLNSLRAVTLIQAVWRAKKARSLASKQAEARSKEQGQPGFTPAKPHSTYWDVLTVTRVSEGDRKVKDAYNTGRMVHVHSPSSGQSKNIYDTIKHLTWIITHTERDVVKLMDFKTLFAALKVRFCCCCCCCCCCPSVSLSLPLHACIPSNAYF
jgi:hypothetical protein